MGNTDLPFETCFYRVVVVLHTEELPLVNFFFHMLILFDSIHSLHRVHE
jgi:hypothetical protein